MRGISDRNKSQSNSMAIRSCVVCLVACLSTVVMPRVTLGQTPNAADKFWDDRFGGVGSDDLVRAVAFAQDGDIYAGGTFQAIGGESTERVARWDGRRWHGLDGGMLSLGSTDAFVNAIAVSGTDIIVGGNFDIAGFEADPSESDPFADIKNIAKWDSKAKKWSALGNGLPSFVFDIAINDQGQIHAAGNFGVKRFTGTAWVDVGTAGLTNAIEFWNGTLYCYCVAGVVQNVRLFDGQDWKMLQQGLGNVPRTVSSMVAGRNALYVAGSFDIATNKTGTPQQPVFTSVTVNSIAKWDGQNWSALSGGVTLTQADSSVVKGSVNALAYENGVLYAAGAFSKAGSVDVSGVAMWEGGGWKAMSGPNASAPAGVTNPGFPTSVGVVRPVAHAITARSGVVVVGGLFNSAGDEKFTGNIARFGPPPEDVQQANRWSGLGKGLNMTVKTIVKVPGKDVMAIGGAFDIAGDRVGHFATRWNGTDYTAFGNTDDPTVLDDSPLPGGAIQEVAAIAHGAATLTSEAQVYLGGLFQFDIPGNNIVGGNNIIQFADRAGWAFLGFFGIGDPSIDLINAVAVAPNGDVYVGGRFSNTLVGPNQTLLLNNIAKWDGRNWSALAGANNSVGVCGTVHTIEILADGQVFVGGNFERVGPCNPNTGTVVNSLVRWANGNWSPVMEGEGLEPSAFPGVRGSSAVPIDLIFGQVLALTASGDSLYVGGSFSHVHTTDGLQEDITTGLFLVNNIVRFDLKKNKWFPMDKGVAGSVQAIAISSGGTVYIGGRGEFADRMGNELNGIAGGNIARWDGKKWQPMGSGVDSVVDALAFGAKGSLYVGGGFFCAGQKPSHFLARWTASGGVSSGAIKEIKPGTNAPAAKSTASKGATNVPMHQHVVTATQNQGVTIKKLTVEAKGTGDDAKDITSVKVWVDANGNGRVDTGEQQVGTGKYDVDDGTLEITFDPPLQVAAGTFVTVLVTYDISPTAGAPRKRIAAMPIGGAAVVLGLLMALGVCARLGGFRLARRRVGLLVMCLGIPLLALTACEGDVGGGGAGGNGAGGGGGGNGASDATTFSVTVTGISAEETDTGDDSTIDGLILEGTTLTITP